MTAEHKRLQEDAEREKNWKRWGPYLPARQWATVREDYSKGGNSWHSFDYEAAERLPPKPKFSVETARAAGEYYARR